MTVEDKALLNHTAAYCRLVETMKRAKEHNRPFCMFLGAGCSLTSSKHSITTEQVIKDCLKQCMGSEYVVPNSWESLYKDFVNNVWNAYAADDRQEILYERFKDLEPSIGYKKLKELVANGYIQYIITTNFDMLLDGVLSGIAHNVQVFNLPVRKIKGGSNISLLKVHGDIENGSLRFSPNELIELPQDISQNIFELSRNNCLVCGYRGQDDGVMRSLNQETEYSAFWVSPNLPLSTDKYENQKIFNWMQKRNSENNFIYGNNLGTFDGLMCQLTKSLLGSDSHDFLPNYWDNNVITQSLKSNEKAFTIFNNILKCSSEHFETLQWKKAYPFYAEKFETVIDAYLFFYKYEIEKVPLPFKLPENEIESLLVGVSLEMIARTSGTSELPTEYTKNVIEIYNNKNYDYEPNSDFWNALLIILSSMQDTNEKPKWSSVDSIGLNLNNHGRFSINIKKPMLQEIAAVISKLNFCSILCPTCDTIENTDIKQRTKLLLENYALPISFQDKNLVLYFEKMDKRDYQQICSLFLDKQIAGLKNTITIVAPEFEINQGINSFYDNSFFEYVCSKSKALSKAYLGLKNVFEYDSDIYIKTETEETIDNFIGTKYTGLFLIGTSGSGKTKAIQNFVKSNNENFIIAATTQKTCMSNNGFGISSFFDEIFHDISQLDNNLVNLNDSLIANKKKLILIFDGINEMQNGFDDCIKQYKEMITLIDKINNLDLDNIKIIVSCRDFAFLDYCEITGLFPSAENCYGVLKNTQYIPYYQILSLDIETQIKFCKAYITNDEQYDWFVVNLKTNKYFRENFTHPYLIAIAGKYCSTADVNNINFINNIFMKFTDEMLNRLSEPEFKFLGQEIINEYYKLIISSKNYNNITNYTLLGNEKFSNNRKKAYQVLKELKDINLFTGSAKSDSLRISHDRIEEYLLFRYLYYGEMGIHNISNVINILTVDSIYSCAVQKCFDMYVFEENYQILLDHLIDWYNINPQLIPIIFVKSLCNIDSEKYIIFFNYIINRINFDNVMKIIVLGLKQLITQSHLIFPMGIIEAFEIIVETYPQYSDYLVELYYISSKYFYESKNNYNISNQYCEKALNICDPNSTIYNVIQLEKNIHKSNKAEGDDILNEFENLYNYFKSKGAYEYVAECCLFWGSLLRKKTRFEEAIKIYNFVERANIKDNIMLLAALDRKIGTANKNIMQRLIRNRDIKRINQYYSNAISSFNDAKKLLANKYDLEMLSLISEMAETSIIIIPFIPKQRYFADLYINEEERMLSYIPIPEYQIIHMRNKARLLTVDKEYDVAIELLVLAKKLAKDPSLSFRLFEVNYQICRLICKNWDDVRSQNIKIGIEALDEALHYNLDFNNEYYQTLLKTKEIYDNKLNK